VSYLIFQSSRKVFKISFQFKLSTATVLVESVGVNRIYLTSKTDGYHWFEFWLAQEPGSNILFGENDNNTVHATKVKKLWESHNFLFMPEDKETFYLKYGFGREFDSNLMNALAKIIEPRFAQRDKFFPPGAENKLFINQSQE